MFDYSNMENKELSKELATLTDDNFCMLIKDIDSAKLKEIQASFSIEKRMRIFQELQAREATKSTEKNVEVIQKLNVPATANDIAPTPNLLLRSSLFSASKTHGAETDAIKDFVINTYGEKTTISLTAFRHFNQLDLDLLLELIKLQQVHNKSLFKVTVYELVKKTKGRGEGKTQYEQIKGQIKLLQNASIEIKYGRYSFVGSIISSAYFDDIDHLYVIKFNEDLQSLFSNNSWTGIDINTRKQLKTNLAKWLHGFYSSHLNSKIPIKLETIYQLSGANDKDIARWNRETVVKALDNIKLIFENNKKHFNYKIKNEYLYINKSQSLIQNKSIKNKIVSNNLKS